MKVLSLKQPYAELILQGKKKIEIRKWNTKFRGEFFIHASKIPDEKAMKKFNFNYLPCGFIVGKAELVDVKKYPSKIEFEKDKVLHLATYDFGNQKKPLVLPIPSRVGFLGYRTKINYCFQNFVPYYGFILKNVSRLDKPIKAKGKLGFWELRRKNK